MSGNVVYLYCGLDLSPAAIHECVMGDWESVVEREREREHVLTELLYLCLGIKPSVLTLYTTALSGAIGPLKYTIVKCLQCM